ncbi:multicopper oxidase domain-containing protein [Salinimicrobium catena]|uniref:multicopper oxidase domain-containing protein n=1 Tax=Salinimicrobium catena TaxID=390640 RepID=UPI002FE4DBEA
MKTSLLKRSLTLLILSLSFTIPSTGQEHLEPGELDPLSQPKFVNPLPFPATFTGTYHELTLSQFTQGLGVFDPATLSHSEPTEFEPKVWGYNGSYPGPTIEATTGTQIQVKWVNDLPKGNVLEKHLFRIDPSIHWAGSVNGNSENGNEGHAVKDLSGIPSITHLHGGHSEAASDGHPEAWYTPGLMETGPQFYDNGGLFTYHNDQEAATLWYHDHTLGITRLNVYAGLAGFYILRDSWEENLGLPSGDYEIPLVIQDRRFYENGELYYPYKVEELEDPLEKPLNTDGVTVLPEMFGDFILVNGKAWPFLEVEPRKYRLRLLNGSDSRFYDLFLPGITFYQIGSDGGLLAEPVRRNRLLVGPGERLDVIVDFSDPGLWGQTLILKNNARSPFPFGTTPTPQTSGQIMAFKVVLPMEEGSVDESVIPHNLRPAAFEVEEAVSKRKLVLFEGTDEYGRLKPMLGTAEEGRLPFTAEVTEKPELNTVEEWEIYNTTADAHPIHLHLVHFQVINTQKFNTKKFVEGDPDSIKLLGQPTPPSAGNAGRKDTFIVYPGEVARVRALFDKEGLYVWHCHILSHEDYDMMRPFEVIKKTEEVATVGNTFETSSTFIKDLSEENIEKFEISPNPVKDVTRIRFSFRKASKVIIQIHDFSGKIVATPFKGSITTDRNYEVMFDRGGLPGSTYICKISTDDGRSYEKLIVVE